MGFAASYLQKHAVKGSFPFRVADTTGEQADFPQDMTGEQADFLKGITGEQAGFLQDMTGESLVRQAPDPLLKTIVIIPATGETGLIACLDSLFHCEPAKTPVEVLVLINSREELTILSGNSVSDPAQTFRGGKYNTEKNSARIRQNREIYREAASWARTHSRSGLVFHIILIEGLPAKHYGAGLARKLVMDEAVRRFDRLDRPGGVIVSLDADTRVAKNYLLELTALFDREPRTDGCSIRFRHPVSRAEYHQLFNEKIVGPPGPEKKFEADNQFPAAVFDAIVNYELHQRYYLQAIRYTEYPWAFHTVGSAFAVRAAAYCRQGGMSKRQAGEDFYFIQKVAMQGHYTACNSTEVFPSPRPSDRVPFGTGPDIARQLDTLQSARNPAQESATVSTQQSVNPTPPAGGPVPYLTYHPQLFEHLKKFYAIFQSADPGLSAVTDRQFAVSPPWRIGISQSVRRGGPADLSLSDMPEIQALHPLMQAYLEETGFIGKLNEIRKNTATEKNYRQRFFRKFNMFWLLKYLHFAEKQGVEKMEVADAALYMLQASGLPLPEKHPNLQSEKRTLLQIYRDFPV